MQTIIFSDILSPGYGKNAGAYRIATELRKHGYSCLVVDFFCHYTEQEITQIIDKFVTSETIWVGFSTTFMIPTMSENSKEQGNMFSQIWGSTVTDYFSAYPAPPDKMKELFKYIKGKSDKVQIVVGGARSHNAQNYDGFIRRVRPDFFVHGFADVATIVLTKWLDDPLKYPEPKFNGRLKNVIDSTNDYDYEHYNQSSIRFTHEDMITPNEFLPIEIARGCIFKCKFCNFSLLGKKRGDYTRTKEVLVDEFLYNYETFGTTNYMFMDETTNDSMEKVEFLHDVIASLPFKIKWAGYSRLELYANNPEMVPMIQETGISHTFFGIETFNKKSGEAVGKGMHPDKVKAALHSIRQVWKDDVKTSAGFIVGLPHDTPEDFVQLKQYLNSNECSLDAWVVHALILANGMPSMFGQDPGKYGYSFKEKESVFRWHRDNMNFDQAMEAAIDIRDATQDKCHVNTWLHLRLQNLGYSKSFVDSLTVGGYGNKIEEIQQQKMNRKEQYFKHLMVL